MNKAAVLVMGWPPICSYRRKSIENEKECLEGSKKLVTKSIDEAPFLGKLMSLTIMAILLFFLLFKISLLALLLGGRYLSPEEVPFFPDNLPPSLVQPQNCSQDLAPKAATVSVNNNIRDMYVNTLLPLLAPQGDDGNYALAVSSDLACLQAISRRIHYGKYVAEVKFQGETEAYSVAIRAKDKNTLMNLLTDDKVEAMVKQRVEKKAMVFGQEVTLSDTNNSTNYKVDPSLVSRLYNEWIIPLTKDVEVEYLLRRLD